MLNYKATRILTYLLISFIDSLTVCRCQMRRWSRKFNVV